MVYGGGEFSIFVFLFSFLPLVSVPLRGKEGAGRSHGLSNRQSQGAHVSVPLRGKEGAGLKRNGGILIKRFSFRPLAG